MSFLGHCVPTASESLARLFDKPVALVLWWRDTALNLRVIVVATLVERPDGVDFVPTDYMRPEAMVRIHPVAVRLP